MTSKITNCPSCGVGKLEKVRRTYKRDYEGKVYAVPNVSFLECSNCGEQLFDSAAIDKIQGHPARFVKAHG
ncbi:MAG: YgiT-type zinc finger protein [Candidatus Hydrogenedentota bacterium]